MKRIRRCIGLVFFSVALSLCVGVFSGCAALHARGDAATMIPAKSASAQPVVDASKAGTLAEATARAYLAGDGLYLATVDGTMTVNWFAYAFGDKQVFVTAALYNKIHAVAQDATANARRATSCPADDAKAQAVAEAQALIYLEQARQGTK